MPPHRLVVGAVLLCSLAPTVRAQQAVPVAAVIAAYQADSGVPTRGLAWDRGSSLPITWESARPVAAEDWVRQQGLTLSRIGSIRVAISDTLARDAKIALHGNQQGIQQLDLTFESLDSWITAPLEETLQASLTLRPYKCARETEGASFGNVAWVAKAPGRTASGLLMNWNCGHDGCGILLGLRYRRAELDAVECSGG